MAGALSAETNRRGSIMDAKDTRQCPECGGEIKAAAKLCKHCKKTVVPAAVIPPPQPPVSSTKTPEKKQTPPTSSLHRPLSPEDQKIVDALIKRRLMTQEQFKLAVQNRKAIDRDLLAFLARKGVLTEPQVENVKASVKSEEDHHRGKAAFKKLKPQDLAIRKILLSQGLVNESQIIDALGQHQGSDTPLLEVLGKTEVLTPAQIQAVTAAYREQLSEEGKRIGGQAVQKLMISQEQFDQALEIQKSSDEPIAFGDVLVEQGFITTVQRDALPKSGYTAVDTLKAAVTADAIKDLGHRARNLSKRTKQIAGVLSLLVVVIVMIFALRGKPKITPNCTMNGRGEGSCSFTNRGSSGSICGTLLGFCKSGGTESSNTICSGEIEKNETKNVPISLPEFGKMYAKHKTTVSWIDSCGFSWVPYDE